MKNIFKKSMPLLAALAMTTTALPLSLAATTTVSAEANDMSITERTTGTSTYFLDHWVQKEIPGSITKVEDGKTFYFLCSEKKEGQNFVETNLRRLSGTYTIGRLGEFNFDQFKKTIIHNVTPKGTIFNEDAAIYYYNE